jgi:DNA-binding Xre family transcriptional regulator
MTSTTRISRPSGEKDLSMTKTKKFRELADSIKANPRRHQRIEQYRRAMDNALALAELRKAERITQRELARRLNMSQANVSRIEHEQDVYLSTLQHYVEALGGEIELTAVFGDRRIKL